MNIYRIFRLLTDHSLELVKIGKLFPLQAHSLPTRLWRTADVEIIRQWRVLRYCTPSSHAIPKSYQKRYDHKLNNDLHRDHRIYELPPSASVGVR